MTLSVAKACSSLGPVGYGLGRFSGYRPNIGLPFKFFRTCRSISDMTVNAQTKMHSSPAMRCGFFKNMGATASGPLR